MADPLKPLLVGEMNPYGVDQRYALFPLPRGSAGWRLCHEILGMRRTEYIGSFERVNLLVGASRWSVPAARDAAEKLAERSGTRPIIMLGARVAVAFGREEQRVLTLDGDKLGRTWVRLPHPSGLCRTWNEPDAVKTARQLVELVLRP